MLKEEDAMQGEWSVKVDRKKFQPPKTGKFNKSKKSHQEIGHNYLPKKLHPINQSKNSKEVKSNKKKTTKKTKV